MQELVLALPPAFPRGTFAHCVQGMQDEDHAHFGVFDARYYRIAGRRVRLFGQACLALASQAVGFLAAFLAVAVGSTAVGPGVEGAEGQLAKAALASAGSCRRGLTGTSICRVRHWRLSAQALVSVALDTGVCCDKQGCFILFSDVFHNSSLFNLRL